jgi:hypothetical protein
VEKVKAIIGLILIVGGIVFGLWAGIWWAFIGGIVQIVEQVRAEQIDAYKVAFGVVKIVFAGAIGGISAFVLIRPGAAFLKNA